MERGESSEASVAVPSQGSPSPRALLSPPSPTHLHAMPVSSTSSLLGGKFLFNVSISSAFLFLRCFRQWLESGVIIKLPSKQSRIHPAGALDGLQP